MSVLFQLFLVPLNVCSLLCVFDDRLITAFVDSQLGKMAIVYRYRVLHSHYDYDHHARVLC